jgi:hypothetical protein
MPLAERWHTTPREGKMDSITDILFTTNSRLLICDGEILVITEDGCAVACYPTNALASTPTIESEDPSTPTSE